MFEIGQLVVYIRDSSKAKVHDNVFPIKHYVYRIRGFESCHKCNILGIVLEEIINKPYSSTCANCKKDLGDMEAAFWPQNFRPVSTTDTEMFNELTKPVNDPEELFIKAFEGKVS